MLTKKRRIAVQMFKLNHLVCAYSANCFKKGLLICLWAVHMYIHISVVRKFCDFQEFCWQLVKSPYLSHQRPNAKFEVKTISRSTAPRSQFYVVKMKFTK